MKELIGKIANEISETQEKLIELYLDSALAEYFFLNFEIDEEFTEEELNIFREALLDVENWLANDEKVSHLDYQEALRNHPDFTAKDIIEGIGYNQGF